MIKITKLFFVLIFCFNLVGLSDDNMDSQKLGEIFIKGNYSGKLIEHTFIKGLGLVQTKDFEISIENTSDFIPFNLESIRIPDFNKRDLLKVGKYYLTDIPKLNNEIFVKLEIKNTCGDINCKEGELEIKYLDKEKIIGELTSKLDNKNELKFHFNVPIVDRVSRLPLPIRKLDGTIVKHRLIDDDYPENDLKFNKIVLQGKVGDVVFENLETEAEVNYKNFRFEIKVRLPETKLKRIEVDFIYFPMYEKLCIGEYNLIPISLESNIPLDYEKLSKNELYAMWEDKRIGCRFLPVEGTLNIIAYAQNGMAGEFDIIIHGKDNNKSNLKGRFKLPIDLE